MRENWDYDYHSHRVILNVGQNWLSRRGRRERNITAGLLNRPRIVVLAIIITVLVALLLREAKSVLASNPQFVIQDIILENTGIITKDVLYDILKLEKNKGPLNVSINEVSEILKKDPDIERAVVEKVLPGAFKISIKERIPCARLDINGKEYCVDKNGLVLLRERDAGSAPLVTGLRIKRLVPGEPCMAPGLENALRILQVGEDTDWGRFVLPVKIEFKNSENILVYTRERIVVKLNMDFIKEQMDRFVFIMDDIERKGKLIKMVDLRFKDVYVE